MIFTDVSPERLTEMQSRLLFEGIFNRDLAITNIAQKSFAVIEDIKDLLWKARNLALHAIEPLGLDEKKALMEKLGLPEESSASDLANEFFCATMLCDDALRDFQETMDSMV